MEQPLSLSYSWLATDDTHPVVCFLCGGAHPTETVYAFSINEKEFRISKCTHDGMLFLSPQPGARYADSLYNHPTYYEGNDDMYGMAVNDEERAAQVARIRVQELLEVAPDRGSFLEIGCGYGNTLLEARKQGFEDIAGVEFSASAVTFCREKGLPVVLGSANEPLDAALRGKKYAVIAAYSVLEHLDDPLAFVKAVRGSLEEGGVLIVRVPEMSEQGPWLSLVDHLWHFTKDTLRATLEQAGCTVQNIFPSGTFTGIQHPGKLQSITAVCGVVPQVPPPLTPTLSP